MAGLYLFNMPALAGEAVLSGHTPADPMQGQLMFPIAFGANALDLLFVVEGHIIETIPAA